MYIPKDFEVTDKKEIHAFIEANAFGQLISNSNGRLFSTHIPFLLSSDKSSLIGHLAKQNTQAHDIEGQEVLVTLQGAHDYISPSWYTSPGVPTWNYQAISIYGRCKVLNSTDAVSELVDTLTTKYESNFSSPWQPEYKPSMLGAIIGIEILIGEIRCKYKLSQNRSTKDQEQVIEQLKLNGSNKLAAAMERNEL
jgi:transcriptional regulator